MTENRKETWVEKEGQGQNKQKEKYNEVRIAEREVEQKKTVER